MSTFLNLKNAIIYKKLRGVLTLEYIESVKVKMDVFLFNDRITQEEYQSLIAMLEE